ncbi:hypothetical protein [Sphingomonas xanthus]|uniref:Uncharacterized protein n=1 Tax=Sphingomonas xanthus TaxID=2594473 RepID=A0A516IT35_9SPHN|nr:hypothetical protein [Sphingomonas xanthus]QDP20055.1 hypothetical protein FMM02_08845 [Sphingomonas xanthus]
MASRGSVTGWKLDRDDRAKLLALFPPQYADTDADHVTLARQPRGADLPPEVDAQVVGRADDGDSLECLVVSVDGTTDRPDGSTFHITWSLDRSKRQARESNNLLKENGWQPIDRPIPIRIEPARF